MRSRAALLAVLVLGSLPVPTDGSGPNWASDEAVSEPNVFRVAPEFPGRTDQECQRTPPGGSRCPTASPGPLSGDAAR